MGGMYQNIHDAVQLRWAVLSGMPILLVLIESVLVNGRSQTLLAQALKPVARAHAPFVEGLSPPAV